MDALNNEGPRDQPLVIVLHGSTRGKLVAALCHGYALIVFKLGLAPASENAPWRRLGKPMDYFVWRKAMVAEQIEIERTLGDLFGGAPIPVGEVPWPLYEGRTSYNEHLANTLARDYAKMCIKALGLGG